MLRSHGLQGGRIYYTPSLSIGNTHLGVLLAIRDFIGAGHISSHGRRPIHHKPAWGYWLHGRRQLEPLLIRLRPYLIIKADQADELLAFMSHMHQGGNPLTQEEKEYRSGSVERIRLLNRKGA